MDTRLKTGDRQRQMLSVAIVALLATIACGQVSPPARVGELRSESESVDLPAAESVRVEVNMAAGDLTLSGGADKLLEADFTYNVAELKPEVKYTDGRLVVSTPDAAISAGSLRDLVDYRYEWDLRFNDNLPMEMKVNVAAGSADLQLGSLSLTALDMETGASDVKVDLSGSSSLRRLGIDAGVGRTMVDLSGNWQDDLDANISSGVGEMTLQLPRDVCVRVDAEGGLGNVETRGLTKDGNVYVNDACGVSETTLRIDISTGLGTIRLEVEE